jgi:dTDP-4-dehydrorhamnose reductase
VRVAVTGANGRLGRALIAALEEAPFTGPMGPVAWTRTDLDLDRLDAAGVQRLLVRDRPEVVIHAAAWTDVDGCAREPALAVRRNGDATGVLARACAAGAVDLVAVSTNEVFDGTRTDGRGYAPDDERSPANPYGASKADGERQAWAAFDAADAAPGPRLAIVRTGWLHGPPGNDFPEKIARAAHRARDAGEPLRVVGDEIGTPTYTRDVADAIVELMAEDAITDDATRAIHHLVNGGRASRADWAREVLRATGIDVEVEEVPASTWQRASTPPLWAVLEPTPLPSGEPMRHWRDAFADAVPALRRALARG